MKKCITGIFILFAMLSTLIAGCGKSVENGSLSSAMQSIQYTFTPEDYVRSNVSILGYSPIFDTEKGFYFNASYSTLMFLKYYDKATKKDVFLCNKPDCTHVGNEFCTATSYDYAVLDMAMYNGKLIINVFQRTETQDLYKLLCAAPDGSSLSELVTYYSVDNYGLNQGYSIYPHDQMIIHRNIAVINIKMQNQNTFDNNSFYYGTALVDLNSKKVTFADETPVSPDNSLWINPTAYGDYLYYAKRDGHKTKLHRRSVSTGMDEEVPLERNFIGTYAVMDDDKIYYLRSTGRSLMCFHYSTGKSEEYTDVFKCYRTAMQYDDNFNPLGIETRLYSFTDATDLLTDGEYLYVGHDGTNFHGGSYYQGPLDATEGLYNPMIEILDKNANPVRYNVPYCVTNEGITPGGQFLSFGINGFFVQAHSEDFRTYSIYHCSRESFLSGEPKYELILQYKDGEIGSSVAIEQLFVGNLSEEEFSEQISD